MENVCRKMENKSLAKYSSMKTGGCAREIYFPEKREQFEELLRDFLKKNIKFVVFGNMSNVLLSDEGIDVPVIITTNLKNVETVSDGEEKALVYADCGVSLTKFSFDMCKKGFADISFAYGIPGTVGGGVYMNAGAYGGELSNVVKEVYAIDEKGNSVTISKAGCAFGYRDSVFKHKKLYVVGTLFEFEKKDAHGLCDNAKAFMDKRIEKQPLEYPSCGSTFKRPQGYFAGTLIEEASLKGKQIGGACVSEKHAGFVVNKGDATTQDVLSLMKHVREEVKKKSGVTLEAEILLVDKNGDYFEL